MLRRYKKGIAILLLLTFGQEIFLPSTLWALTGGPSQPEVNSFEPVGTNQMVDLSSGDFNYNIPLMVVPGPNGGYPINLAYHAGIGMEQEASWVGLGWNINPGAITRNLRGIPDDFNGDEIVKTTNLKPNRTIGMTIEAGQLADRSWETWGIDLSSAISEADLGVYYNNYRGVGHTLSLNPISYTSSYSKLGDKSSYLLISSALTINFDSQTGMGVDNHVGLYNAADKANCDYAERGFGVGLGVHSRQGLQSIRFNGSRSLNHKSKGRFSGGITFANQTYVPSSVGSMIGVTGSTNFSISYKNKHKKTDKMPKIEGRYVENRLKKDTRSLKSYGTMYLENNQGALISSLLESYGAEYDRMSDVNLYNDLPISKNSVNMGVPVMTTDVYMISGQGIGGVFRGHRNDLGRLYEVGETSFNLINGSGLELSAGSDTIKAGEVSIGTVVAIGGDNTSGFTKGYTGRYTGTESIMNIESLDFEGKSDTWLLHEPFYFKVIGEQTANSLGEWNYMGGEEPIAFGVGLKWGEGESSPRPIMKNNLFGLNGPIPGTLSNRFGSSERIKRVQNIGYRTKDEIVHDDHYIGSERAKHILNSEGALEEIDYVEIDGRPDDADANSHIHEYSILRPDGTTYIYGLPAYNLLQKEVVFANTTASGIPDKYSDSPLVNYNNSDAGIANDEGVDHYYSSTEIPSYVHSHLITEINSADYVDLTGNGPSEDDFGFYAKFNYSEVNNYRWRDPFYDANYIKGYYSNESDDKASYAYGEKNLYYVNSIETKTHIAIFELGDRADGQSVNSEDQTSGSDFGAAKQKYLKTIKLYSKNDLEFDPEEAVPLQTIHFEYTYELCPGIHNNDPTTALDPNHILSNEGGKLTLKRVYITYNGNEKGRFSPYTFDYAVNKSYNRLNMDRWGNYQESEIPNEHAIHPYTRQDIDSELGYGPERKTNAAAWCLTEIGLPSGADITVEYESDDYGYVQNQRAAQMVEIFGFSHVDAVEVPSGGSLTQELSKKNVRLWFIADHLEGVTGDARKLVIQDYIEGLEEIYFKAYENLKDEYGTGTMASDYVAGYAKVDRTHSNYFGADPTENYGYIDLEKVKYKSGGLKTFSTHPFRKAGWQYIKYNRPDLFNDQAEYDDFFDEAGAAALSYPLSLSTAFSEALNFIVVGEYNKYALMGYCESLDPAWDKRSFVRLNSPNKLKFGGGHRVKSIRLSDNWIEGEREFGTEYEYKNLDGSTSGVADYEPLIGGEENALKKRIGFNGNESVLSIQDRDLYLETPIAEAVFPGARVVYGRVVQKNLSGENVSDSQSGIIVNEFYTAKNFPVETNYTDLQHEGYNFPVYIPMVGQISVRNNGFSQGYVVILNDMSGKPKAVSTYPYKELTASDKPVSSVEYIYKTNKNGGLDNKVLVADGHGLTRKAIVGVEQDFTIHEEQNNELSEVIGNEANVNLRIGYKSAPSGTVPVPIPIPGVVITGNHSESMYRGVVTSKIIHKTGILESVKVYSDGSTVVTNNLIFDAETGDPLLTSVNNEWDKPVYNYNYAAHWNYDGMAGAYKNYRANLIFIEEGGQLRLQIKTYVAYIETFLNVDPSTYLIVGDEITVKESGEYNTYYVVEVTSDSFKLEDENGLNKTFETRTWGTITRSGHRNLQAVKSGTIVALSDAFLNAGSPVAPVFRSWNEYIAGENPQHGFFPDERFYYNKNTHSMDPWTFNGESYFLPNVYSCANGNYSNMEISSTEVEFNDDKIHFSNSYCDGWLVFEGHDPGDGIATPREMHFIFPTDIIGYGTSYTEQFVNFSIVSEERDLAGDLTGVILKHLPTGDIFHADWESSSSGQCWETCGSVADILHADAVEFSDDWGDSYPYADLGDPVNADEVLISDSDLNEYRYGKKGIWRAKRTYLYQIPRKQSGVEIAKTRINVDGEYQPWEPYSWVPGSLNPKWDWVSEITRYSPYGFGLEEKSRLSYDPASLGDDDEETAILSSQMYGYSNSVVIATSALSSYFEMGFTGFEQFDESADENNTGHINLTTSGAFDVSKEKSHTGTNSVKLLNTSTLHFNSVLLDPEVEDPQVLQGIEGKDYVISLWVNVEATGSPSGKIEVFNESDVALLNEFGDPVVVETVEAREVIDGWKKLEVKFTMPASGVKVKYTSTGTTYVDDLRIGPYDGGMVTYVYDRKNLWLVAELDGLNYATFYNYDEEGNLVQVKKETEKGVVTVKTARSNTLRRIGS